MWNKRFWVCETNPAVLKKHYQEILTNSGFTIVGYIEKHFEPYGFTGLWLLSESHLAIHTFPEESKSYIELSSCVKKQYDSFLMQSKYDIKIKAKE